MESLASIYKTFKTVKIIYFSNSQMKYPAPYSHPFIKSELLQNVTSKMKKSTSFKGNKQRIYQSQCCWNRSKPLTQGCDPYAPHLKYGVFPRKTRRNTNIQIAQKEPETESIKINRNHLLRDGKKTFKKGQLPDPPLFVIRPIDKSFTRHLSSSGVMHFDIKPLPAVNKLEYKNMSPKFSSNRFLRNKAY